MLFVVRCLICVGCFFLWSPVLGGVAHCVSLCVVFLFVVFALSLVVVRWLLLVVDQRCCPSWFVVCCASFVVVGRRLSAVVRRCWLFGFNSCCVSFAPSCCLLMLLLIVVCCMLPCVV